MVVTLHMLPFQPADLVSNTVILPDSWTALRRVGLILSNITWNNKMRGKGENKRGTRGRKGKEGQEEEKRIGEGWEKGNEGIEGI